MITIINKVKRSMKKINRSPRIYTIVPIVCLLISSCSSNYLDPARINLSEYDPIIKELSGKIPLVDSLFVGPNSTTSNRNIELKNFYFNKALIAVFPKCYKALKENKAVEIVYFSDRCIFIILRKHSGLFKDKLECLKVSDLNNCDISNRAEMAVDKEILLKNGWKYQMVIQFMST